MFRKRICASSKAKIKRVQGLLRLASANLFLRTYNEHSSFSLARMPDVNTRHEA